MVDTGTIVQMVAKPHLLEAKELRTLLHSGDWIPYVTWHHLEELVSHENDAVVKKRLDFIAEFSHVAYLRQTRDGPNLGSGMDVRDCEIAFLVDHPNASHDEIIEGVRPIVRSGFCSGREFLADNAEWWEFFRTYLAQQSLARKEEIVNLTHFPTSNMKERLPGPGQSPPPRSGEEGVKHFTRMASRLERKIRDHGDCRRVDPKVAARRLMREAYDETLPILKEGGDFVDGMMKRDGVSRDRLPINPTFEDMAYEGIFVGQMGVHARRLLKNKEELLSIVRKERLPAWVVWQEVDRRLKQLPNAQLGNLNDKHLLDFGLYVDVINVDKRIADLLRQAAGGHPLLRRVYGRIPQGRGMSGLLKHLQKN